MNKTFLISGLFASLFLLAGCDGDDGADGVAGPAGPAGTDGTNGMDGADGADGVGGSTLPLPTLEGHNGDHGTIMAYDVQAAYNGDTFFWRLSYRGNEGKRHQYLRYDGTAWQKEGGDRRDAQATIDGDVDQGDMGLLSTIYEQRTSIMLSDPTRAESAGAFGEQGCFLSCHDDSRHMPQWTSANGHDGKYILPDDAGAEGDIVADLWHWRGARSNPIAMADDQWIKTTDFPGGGGGNAPGDGSDNGGRKGDGGTSVFFNQGLDADGNPQYLLDPTTTFGERTFAWSDFWTTPFYYMSMPDAAQLGHTTPNPLAVPYADVSGDFVPVDGDTVPRRILRAGAGSRADITAYGTSYTPESGDGNLGVWNVQMQRALDTGSATDDIAMVAGGTYDAGFEVHLWEYTTRDHYVSFPKKITLGDLGVSGAIVAQSIAGTGRDTLPNWSAIPATRIWLFQPGINSIEFLNGTNATAGLVYTDPVTGSPVDQVHGGAGSVTAGAACSDCHNVLANDPTPPPLFDAGSMEALTKQRGGIWADTPVD